MPSPRTSSLRRANPARAATTIPKNIGSLHVKLSNLPSGPTNLKARNAFATPLLRYYKSLPKHSPQRAIIKEEIRTIFTPIINSTASRIWQKCHTFDTSISLEDLQQEGVILLMTKSIDRYNPTDWRHAKFSTFLIRSLRGVMLNQYRNYFGQRGISIDSIEEGEKRQIWAKTATKPRIVDREGIVTEAMHDFAVLDSLWAKFQNKLNGKSNLTPRQKEVMNLLYPDALAIVTARDVAKKLGTTSQNVDIIHRMAVEKILRKNPELGAYIRAVIQARRDLGHKLGNETKNKKKSR